MHIPRRYWVDLSIMLPAMAVQWQLCTWLARLPRLRENRFIRYKLRLLAIGLILLIAIGTTLHYNRIQLLFPRESVVWLQGLSMIWAFLSLGFFVIALLWRRVPAEAWERRTFLKQAAALSFATPAAVLGYGTFVQRDNFTVREIDLPIHNLPHDLEGIRLVQLSDIHLSEYLHEREFARVVDMANGLRGHVALITGDLITRYRDPLDACLRQLARLRAEAGVLGCLGNHEIYALSEDYTTMEGARLGMDFLRFEARPMRFGQAAINFVGVDYQEMKQPYLVGVESLVSKEPNTVNLLLSHNPDVFPIAARQGFDAVLAGHTHGGQVTVEFLHQWVNPARFFTPFISGLYRLPGSAIYISEGIGTIGLPVRIGTQPEVTLLTLRAT